MISAQPYEIARPHVADDIEPRWHVRLPSGMVTMTLDELDAAFQRGTIGEQTLVAREGERNLCPLGVVAGLFEEEHWDVPPAQAASSRASEIFAWESTPLRRRRQARTALWPLTECATLWFAARSPRQRSALAAFLVASLAAVCSGGPAQSRSLAPMPSAQPAPARSPVMRTAPVAVPQKLQVPSAAAASATASTPARAVEPGAALDVPIAREVAQRGSAFAERRSEDSRRSSRRAKATKRRAGRE
jgi:hypothetical protein